MAEYSDQPRITFRRFGALFGLGFLGIIALLVTIVLFDPIYSEQAEQIGISLELLAIVSGVQSGLMLAVSVLTGLFLAPRLGFQSHVLNHVSNGTLLLPHVRSELIPALSGGLGIGVMLVLSEWLAPTLLNEQTEMTIELLVQSILLQLLYGGITEELLLRWGMMTLVVFLLWEATGQRGEQPSSKIVWTAIVVAAGLFGVFHLPVAAPKYGVLTTEVIGYLIGLNANGGVVFGWLFWRHSLEAAMIAHGVGYVSAVSIWIVMIFV